MARPVFSAASRNFCDSYAYELILFGTETTNWGFSALHTGEWNFCAKHHADTTTSKMKSSLFFISYFVFVGYNHLNVWERGRRRVCSIIQEAAPSACFIRYPSWQCSPMCGSVTAWGGQLTKLHCKPSWALSTLHLIWANVNQKLTLHPREGSDTVVKHQSADRVSSNMLLLYH